jgi:hypothetical protein
MLTEHFSAQGDYSVTNFLLNKQPRDTIQKLRNT